MCKSLYALYAIVRLERQPYNAHRLWLVEELDFIVPTIAGSLVVTILYVKAVLEQHVVLSQRGAETTYSNSHKKIKKAPYPHISCELV